MHKSQHNKLIEIILFLFNLHMKSSQRYLLSLWKMKKKSILTCTKLTKTFHKSPSKIGLNDKRHHSRAKWHLECHSGETPIKLSIHPPVTIKNLYIILWVNKWKLPALILVYINMQNGYKYAFQFSENLVKLTNLGAFNKNNQD